jgi:hypothetical protein
MGTLDTLGSKYFKFLILMGIWLTGMNACLMGNFLAHDIRRW